MMKFSTLWAFDRTVDANGFSPVAAQIAQRWQHDSGSVRFFRSSANVIYILTVDGERAFLRCAAATERSREIIENELAIIEHARNAGNSVVRPILSTSGSTVESVETDIGLFHAVLFHGIPGELKEPTSISLDEAITWGATVGNLHAGLSSVPPGVVTKPPAWTFAIESSRQGDEAVRAEGARVEAVLRSVPRDASTYGLLHNDLELDNMVWQDGVPTVLDFDEYSEGWYLTDIAKALDELLDDGGSIDNPRVQAFLAGYRSKRELDDQHLALLPEFSALTGLYGWASLNRAIDMKPDEVDQDWMISMIGRISDYQRAYETQLIQR